MEQTHFCNKKLRYDKTQTHITITKQMQCGSDTLRGFFTDKGRVESVTSLAVLTNQKDMLIPESSRKWNRKCWS